MPAEYLFEKVYETELMNESLAVMIQNSEVSSQASSDRFISFGDGIIDANFFIGNLVTENIENIVIRNSSSYILSIPKTGAYSAKNAHKEERSIYGKSGVLAMPTDKVIYDNSTAYINDYVVLVDEKSLSSVLNNKYGGLKLKSDIVNLSLKNEQVKACFQFIESTLNMVRAFPQSRNSELVQKNIQEIATYMLVDIIAEAIQAIPLINLNPEKYLVSKAEEIMEAECGKLFTIQEVADKVFTSPRNLQAVFKKYRNYSPMQFLKIRKLHQVRKNLLASQGQKRLIKQAALDAGIFDLNRFSQHYAKEFGELPSETLKNN